MCSGNENVFSHFKTTETYRLSLLKHILVKHETMSSRDNLFTVRQWEFVNDLKILQAVIEFNWKGFRRQTNCHWSCKIVKFKIFRLLMIVFGRLKIYTSLILFSKTEGIWKNVHNNWIKNFSFIRFFSFSSLFLESNDSFVSFIWEISNIFTFTKIWKRKIIRSKKFTQFALNKTSRAVFWPCLR